jgi:ribonuclease HI
LNLCHDAPTVTRGAHFVNVRAFSRTNQHCTPYADEAEIEVNRMRKHIHIVTDGSAIGNPGPGGWAAVLSCGRNRWRISGAAENTTANEMELTAAIEALKTIEIGSRVTLCSDSEYLIRGMRHLADRWLLQGWRNTRGRPLRDQALWQSLLLLRSNHFIEWQWVRGHNGHPSQTEADALAYMEARREWLTQRLAA